MKSQMENNIRSEMKEMKERLDTLTASLEEDKDEGQLHVTSKHKQKFTITHEENCTPARQNMAWHAMAATKTWNISRFGPCTFLFVSLEMSC